MTERVFVDTNVLVYSFDQQEPEKQIRAREWLDRLIVASARAAECSILLTEDLQHSQDLDGLRVADPFQVSADLRA